MNEIDRERLRQERYERAEQMIRDWYPRIHQSWSYGLRGLPGWWIASTVVMTARAVRALTRPRDN